MSESQADDPAAASARLWVRVAGLLHPATTDRERLEVLLELLAAVERGPGAEVAEDSTAAIVAAVRETPTDDADFVARYGVELLERLRRLEPLVELVTNEALSPTLRLRAARALLRVGGETAVPVLEQAIAAQRARNGGDEVAACAAPRPEPGTEPDPVPDPVPGLADRLEQALAIFRDAPLAAAPCGPTRFPGACPACFGDLLYLAGIDLPSPRGDVRRLSLWSCRACGAGVSGDSDRLPRPLFETLHAGSYGMLLALYDDCPRPHDPTCDCPAHREIAQGLA